MKRKELLNLANQIWDIEKSTNNDNISENMSKIENIVSKLSIKDIFLLDSLIEEIRPK